MKYLYSSDILRRPQKIEKISHFDLKLLKVILKKSGRFFQIFVAFSQYLNFNESKFLPV